MFLLLPRLGNIPTDFYHLNILPGIIWPYVQGDHVLEIRLHISEVNVTHLTSICGSRGVRTPKTIKYLSYNQASHQLLNTPIKKKCQPIRQSLLLTAMIAIDLRLNNHLSWHSWAMMESNHPNYHNNWVTTSPATPTV